METTQLPFQIDSLYGGCMKIDGIVTAGSEQLTLEYRMSDNLLGAWIGGITSRAIPYVDLERAECRMGFFSPRLILTARTLQVFDKLPTSAPAQLSLSVPWKHRGLLRAFAAEIDLALSYRAADRHQHRIDSGEA